MSSPSQNFESLFKEFKDTFVDTPLGEEHFSFYERDANQGKSNFLAIENFFEQEDIANSEEMSNEIIDRILKTFLPHSDTPTHRVDGYWIHRAPAIQGDIKTWYEADGSKRDWKAVAHAIFHFIKSCLEYSDDKKLQKICNGFSQLTYTNGFQSGMLTPLLNALKPNTFLLINRKSQRTISYFSKGKCSTQIKDYPSANQLGKQLIQELAPITRKIWDSSLCDADQFDMFCHWLVSIKKFDFKSPTVRHWKIAPGENAWQWNECLEQGFIGIGWDELGDISVLSREAFNARRDELIAAHPDWKKAGVNQVWAFYQIKVGDRIVANRGTREVIGIGTVRGNYYYQADAEKYKHRLPVEWDDTTLRSVYKPSWVKTLISLNSDEFRVILRLNEQPTDSDNEFSEVIKSHPNCPFSPTTFELLSKLHHDPKKSVYDAHKQDFKSRLEEPFQRLMLDVAAQLPLPIKEAMEIRHRLFGRILKNDFGQGGAYEHYWGAFYPKGSKRTEGAQLILIAGYDRLTFGFDIGHYSSQQRERFLTNCQKHHDSLVELLEPSLNQPHLRFGDRGKISFDSDGIAYDPDQLSFKQWLKSIDSSGVHVFTTLSKANVLSYSRNPLRDEICKVFSQLFPLVLLATLDEPMSALQEYLDSIESDDEVVVPINEAYSLNQCDQETYLNESLLDTWVRAIHRKGQAVLYGPPGTGKTHLAHRLAKHLISEKDGFVELVQFHPAYTYEDFMQGIRPQRTDNGLDYPTVPGRFLDFCKRARDCQDQGVCVLIIDEINRANLAQVFGELMYLLEYREDKVALAGGKPFSIPKNVRIIGTMNTADRSIALVDHALRRRFAFLPLYPDMNILRKFHADTGHAVESLIQLIEEVNQEINDPQYAIGTSFFLDRNLKANLKAIWQMEIEPYLQEYFFDQTDKVDSFAWANISHRLMP
jgi:5-methylcytosine-specific restriction protein B